MDRQPEITVLTPLFKRRANPKTTFAYRPAAVILGALAYVLGDMLILPAAGNTAATLGDAALTYVVLWAASSMLGWNLSYFDMFVVALVVGIFEFFFHIWLLQTAFPGVKIMKGMRGFVRSVEVYHIKDKARFSFRVRSPLKFD